MHQPSNCFKGNQPKQGKKEKRSGSFYWDRRTTKHAKTVYVVKKKLEMSSTALIKKKRRTDAPDVNRLAKNAALAGLNGSARGLPSHPNRRGPPRQVKRPQTLAKCL